MRRTRVQLTASISTISLDLLQATDTRVASVEGCAQVGWQVAADMFISCAPLTAETSCARLAAEARFAPLEATSGAKAPGFGAHSARLKPWHRVLKPCPPGGLKR